MDKETTGHLAAIGHFMFEQWEFFVSAMGVLLFSFFWWLKQQFATVRRMDECKDKMLVELEKHETREEDNYREFRVSNEAQHLEIRDDIRAIKNHLMGDK